MRLAPLAVFFACASAFAAQRPEHHEVFVIAGEFVMFDANMNPQFTTNQLMNSAVATRVGFVRWAATAHGRRLIDYFNAAEYEVRVTEDLDEEGIGRAPQPGIA